MRQLRTRHKKISALFSLVLNLKILEIRKPRISYAMSKFGAKKYSTSELHSCGFGTATPKSPVNCKRLSVVLRHKTTRAVQK